MTKTYELALALNPTLGHAELTRQIHVFTQIVKDHGGSVVEVLEEGRRETAYPLQGENEAYFLFIKIQLAADQVVVLSKTLELHPDVRRYLITIYEELPVTAPKTNEKG